jgi:hypothetical protein
MSGGYAVASTAKVPRRIPRMSISNKLGRVRPAQPKERRTMKISLKQRFRNWLLQDNDDDQVSYAIEDCEGPNIQSQGFRLNVYGASGGTIIETTKYDRKNDDNRHSLHVVTEDKDLGEELSKIITMESLR